MAAVRVTAHYRVFSIYCSGILYHTSSHFENYMQNRNVSSWKHIVNKNALTENKPPLIRMIRISDFGLPDSKRDPDRHQNCITWSLCHALPSTKFRQNPLTSLRVIRWTDRQTDIQTDRQTNRPHRKHNLLLSAEVTK